MMKIIANSSFYLLHYGVFENGDILEVKKELAEKLIEQGLVENIPLEKEEVKEVIDYTKLKVSELKKILDELEFVMWNAMLLENETANEQ